MKLTQNYENHQAQQQREYEQFRQQILRHGIAFGVVYGNHEGYSQDTLLEVDPGPVSTKSRRLVDLGKQVQTIVVNLVRASVKLKSRIMNHVSEVLARPERRRVVGQWLKLSDHILEDIGMVRSDLEDLYASGADPEDYIREVRANRQNPERKLRLIDCAGPDTRADADPVKADTRLDTGLHQAA